jgi:hypothetical protein
VLSRDLGIRREHISTNSVLHDSSNYLAKSGIKFNKNDLKNARNKIIKRKNVSELELKPRRFHKIKSQLDFEQTNEAYYGIDGSSSTISFSNL